MAQKKAPKAPTAAPEAGKEEKKIAPEVKKPEVKKAPVVEKPAVISEKTVMEEELPDYAKRVLKLYPDVPEMYISRKGGVFFKDTEPSLRGTAILFKNPYYNKS